MKENQYKCGNVSKTKCNAVSLLDFIQSYYAIYTIGELLEIKKKIGNIVEIQLN